MTQNDTERIERVIEVLATATGGDYSIRVPVEDCENPLIIELEVGTNGLLDDLALSLAKNEDRQRKIEQQAQQLLEKQAELVRTLSTPVMMVWPGVLALPIIGTVEAERALLMTESILNQVVANRATHVILDLTGTDELVEATAKSLLRMAQAIKLLGARCLITGISPQTAKTIGTLHLDLNEVKALPLVSDALASIMNERSAKAIPQRK